MANNRLPMAYSAFRVLAAVAGLLSLYFAFFVYPGEAGKLRDRVEDLWKRIGQQNKPGVGIAVAFFNTVAQAVNNGFDRLYGPQLVSLRSFGVAASYSLFGFWAGFSLLVDSD